MIVVDDIHSLSSESNEWYHQGQARVVEVDGIHITVRFVGRDGRRGRIAITAPAGAKFRAVKSGDQRREFDGRRYANPPPNS